MAWEIHAPSPMIKDYQKLPKKAVCIAISKNLNDQAHHLAKANFSLGDIFRLDFDILHDE